MKRDGDGQGTGFPQRSSGVQSPNKHKSVSWTRQRAIRPSLFSYVERRRPAERCSHFRCCRGRSEIFLPAHRRRRFLRATRSSSTTHRTALATHFHAFPIAVTSASTASGDVSGSFDCLCAMGRTCWQSYDCGPRDPDRPLHIQLGNQRTAFQVGCGRPRQDEPEYQRRGIP